MAIVAQELQLPAVSKSCNHVHGEGSDMPDDKRDRSGDQQQGGNDPNRDRQGRRSGQPTTSEPPSSSEKMDEEEQE